MNERFNSTAANRYDDERTPRCERAADLVAYLYGEANAAEAKSFAEHMHACAICRDELAAFGVVREAVGAWRREAFDVSLAPMLDEALAPQIKDHTARAPRRSALAAVREFFTLSPMWLRAGALAATMIICALSALTLARTEIRWDADGIALRMGVSRERIVIRTVGVPAPDTFTREQVDAMVKGEVARARQELQAEFAASNSEHQPTVITTGDRPDQKRAGAGANLAQQRVPRRPGSPNTNNVSRGSSQVAEFGEEENPTSLYDLLRVVN